MLKFKLFSICFLIFALGFSQVEEINPPEYIKTIMFKGEIEVSELPIIKLGDQLQLSFDVLNGDEDDFYYEITHHNYDWTPSMLSKAEYLKGFDNQPIRNYENSFNTYQIYSHHVLTIPNERTQGMKVSGNYLLSIYDEDEELVFSRKFMVYEDIVNVGVAIKRSRDVSTIAEKQSVDISISSNTLQFNNPKQTVKTAIIQNNNLNTAIYNLPPQYTMGNELIYRYTNESSFWGGNEYYYFENKEIRVANNGVQFIDLKEDLYHNYLFANVERYKQNYTYNPDVNGGFVTTVYNATSPQIEADYAYIHFSLVAEDIPEDSSIYVYGNYNNYGLNETNRLVFNDETGMYQASILLKQGFYNYKYVVVDAKGNLDENMISGNFYQTENDYKVVVYYRDLGARYDKIVGFGNGNSVNITN